MGHIFLRHCKWWEDMLFYYYEQFNVQPYID